MTVSFQNRFKDRLFQQIVYFFFLAWELQDLLNRVVKKSYEMDDVFHLETCRALVALSDEDKSGRLNFDEFKQIWLGVRSWIETFLKFDQGTFNIVGFHHNFSYYKHMLFGFGPIRLAQILRHMIWPMV